MDASRWAPAAPKDGPPLPHEWEVKWPGMQQMLPMMPREGPPLPNGLGIRWPWSRT